MDRPATCYLVVRILPHARFERRGQDLHTKVRIPVTTAVLGGEVPVETLNGSSLRLRVPELTGSGKVFRLRGHGMPRVGKPDERGDLFVAADVAMPTELSPEQREHYEALRETGTRAGTTRTDHDDEPQSLHGKSAGGHSRRATGGRTQRTSGGRCRSICWWRSRPSVTASCRLSLEK